MVVVKSTSQGGADVFATQDGLYTHVIKGIDNGKTVKQTIINASISRVLSAKEEWAAVLETAANKEMQIVISNTTEVGIVYAEENVLAAEAPNSFPAKLLAWLHKRYETFNGAQDAGMVIIPTELLIDNAGKLKEILLKLAAYNQLDKTFIDWLQTANHFCSSLVDRIVPGKTASNDFEYTDQLSLMSEAYSLWAIETSSKKVKEILSFAKANDAVVFAPDIYKFRELKLRLLNGTHTLSCGLAVLAGFSTVKEAMADESFRNYVTSVMFKEIAVAITDEQITTEEAIAFGEKVIDRFSNPFIEHKWLSISLQYSSKMLMRNVPILQKHYAKHSNVPELIAVGFAAYVLFMRIKKNNKGEFIGTVNNVEYTINDDKAQLLHDHWQQTNFTVAVQNILGDKNLWSVDLNKFSGFTNAVAQHVKTILEHGAKQLIQNIR